MTSEVPDPQSFIDTYGPDARVVFGGGTEMTLGQALQFEVLLCPGNTEARQDPARRVGYLAHILAAGESLMPEHKHLLNESE